MTRYEIEELVLTAREERGRYMTALRTHDISIITKASSAYHQAFDELKNATKWSLTELFAVVNEGKEF